MIENGVVAIAKSMYAFGIIFFTVGLVLSAMTAPPASNEFLTGFTLVGGVLIGVGSVIRWDYKN